MQGIARSKQDEPVVDDSSPFVFPPTIDAVVRERAWADGGLSIGTIFRKTRNRSLTQAVSPDQDIHFASLGIVLDHPFKVFDYHQTGIRVQSDENVKFKGQYVPERGLMIQLGASTRLLSTLGPRLIKRPETPFPTPLLVHLHRRSTSRDLDALTEQVLKFTSLTWRSVQPAEKPVTVYYSELIAELLARLRAIPGWNPATLNTRLRASKWFL